MSAGFSGTLDAMIDDGWWCDGLGRRVRRREINLRPRGSDLVEKSLVVQTWSEKAKDSFSERPDSRDPQSHGQLGRLGPTAAVVIVDRISGSLAKLPSLQIRYLPLHCSPELQHFSPNLNPTTSASSSEFHSPLPADPAASISLRAMLLTDCSIDPPSPYVPMAPPRRPN
ncbi:hypothetical protein BS47DRAFT_1390950 [Hydnum rufescens UP504]|uniref:Uncharacterized protein n=1 Tax=Hydnum rufescens UP504 TaxID=1448309 RepID=A0A9P6DYP2_9AGAM|nr:hypothetical protein BS47DRAFT_1390950 [Hydnum rufescens UP504]